MSRWERGITVPGAYFREKLCSVLDRTPEDLGLIPTTMESAESPSTLSPASRDASQLTRQLITSELPGTDVGELERRMVTILFCDLVGFTPLSERLDPEDVRDIQTMYFGRMSKEIKRFGGIIEKYAGDAVLALFGVPVTHEDDAERAVRCGLSMQTAIQEVAAEVHNRWGVELALRVGVNTGEVVSGIWDTGGRKDYAVTGDAVNTAARLQAVAEPGEVLVGEQTMWLARRRIRFGERREVMLKGKTGAVPVYAAVGARENSAEQGERGPRTPLVDRNDELALLSSIWAKVVQEVHPHLVTVLGEPGIGKSRLVAVFEGSLVNEARILHGRCLPSWAKYTGTTPALPLSTTVRRSPKRISRLASHIVSSPTSTSPGSATACSRAAVFTASPVTA